MKIKFQIENGVNLQADDLKGLFETLHIKIFDIFTNNKTTIEPKLLTIFKKFDKSIDLNMKFAKILSEKQIQGAELQSLIEAIKNDNKRIKTIDFTELSEDVIHSFMTKLGDLNWKSCQKMTKAQTSIMLFEFFMVSVAKSNIMLYECHRVASIILESIFFYLNYINLQLILRTLF